MFSKHENEELKITRLIDIISNHSKFKFENPQKFTGARIKTLLS